MSRRLDWEQNRRKRIPEYRELKPTWAPHRQGAVLTPGERQELAPWVRGVLQARGIETARMDTQQCAERLKGQKLPSFVVALSYLVNYRARANAE